MRPLRDVGRSQGVRTRHSDFHAERHLARRAAKAQRLESPDPWRPRETRGALPAKGPRPASADHTGRAERAGGVEGGVRVAGERYGDTAHSGFGRRKWALAAAGAVVAVCGAAALWIRRESPPQPMTVTPFTVYPGSEGYPSLSPDGNQVAFVWGGPDDSNSDIYVKMIGSGEPLRLTSHPADDLFPAWSPDGRQI